MASSNDDEPRDLTPDEERSVNGIADLYQRYGKWLFSRAVKLNGGDNGRCADYVHEVFVTVTRRWDKISSMTEAKQEAYLAQAIKNQVISGWRHEASKGKAMETLRSQLNVARNRTEPYHAFIESESFSWFMKYVDSLPPQQRKIAFMAYGCALTPKEIADHLGVSPSTVRVTMRNVLKKFRETTDSLPSHERGLNSGEDE